jgi:hypothetical protein
MTPLPDASMHEQLVSDAALLITKALHGTYAGYHNDTYKREREDAFLNPRLGDLNRYEYVSRGLRNYHPLTLQKIIAVKDAPQHYYHYEIIDLITRGHFDLDESFLVDHLHLAHCFLDLSLHQRVTRASLAFAAFRNYYNLTPHTIGQEYPESRIAQCTAIIAMIRVFTYTKRNGSAHLAIAPFTTQSRSLEALIKNFSGGRSIYLSNKLLRSLLTSPDHDPHAVAAIFIERELHDPDDITAILEAQQANPTRALHEGIL